MNVGPRALTELDEVTGIKKIRRHLLAERHGRALSEGGQGSGAWLRR